MDDKFEWPEVTDEQLRKLVRRRGTGTIEDMRDAIELDRRLLAGVDRKAAQVAWRVSSRHHSMGFHEWLFTRNGSVEPLPDPAPPTLAEALEAAKALPGDKAQTVIRYLQAQHKREQELQRQRHTPDAACYYQTQAQAAPPAPRNPQPGELWLTRGGKIARVRANEHRSTVRANENSFPIASDINGYHAHFADGASCLSINEYDLVKFIGTAWLRTA